MRRVEFIPLISLITVLTYLRSQHVLQNITDAAVTALSKCSERSRKSDAVFQRSVSGRCRV